MWVEVATWQGNRIGGSLDNDPENVPGLHSGDYVEVRQEDVFDYFHTFPDKRTEGNTTGPVIQRMEKVPDGQATPHVKPVVPACDAE